MMFDSLFGAEMPLAAKFFIAFAVVLGLIGLTAWLVRRFGANRLGGASRGRQPRLAVIDAASVDGRRRLVLIRRDNVEHLMMIGGPNDLMIEPNIVRAAVARDMSREPARVAAPGETLPRAVPLGDVGTWPLQPAPEPPPAPPMAAPVARGYRSNIAEENWTPPEPPRAPRPDSLTGMAAELSTKLNPDMAQLPPRAPQVAPAPPPPPPIVAPVAAVPAAPAAPVAPPQTDHNLAEMAQRLEAALRRPGAADVHPPATDPLAATHAAPPVKPPEPRAMPPRDFKAEPRVEPRSDIKPEIKTEPARPAPSKAPFDSLEQEMATLLGRPSGKT